MKKRDSGNGNIKSNSLAQVLTAREAEIIKWVQQGKSSWEIARILRISEHTVNFHIRNTLKKLDVRTRAQAAYVTAFAGVTDGRADGM